MVLDCPGLHCMRKWWTVKYRYLYLRSFINGTALREGFRGWFSFYK